ncbi:hypothetical protein VULLAG_LOCUS15120 [Vulpes lagopus]
MKNVLDDVGALRSPVSISCGRKLAQVNWTPPSLKRPVKSAGCDKPRSYTGRSWLTPVQRPQGSFPARLQCLAPG